MKILKPNDLPPELRKIASPLIYFLENLLNFEAFSKKQLEQEILKVANHMVSFYKIKTDKQSRRVLNELARLLTKAYLEFIRQPGQVKSSSDLCSQLLTSLQLLLEIVEPPPDLAPT